MKRAIEELSRLRTRDAVQNWAERNLEPLGQGVDRVVYALNSRKVLKISRVNYSRACRGQNKREVLIWNLTRSPALAQIFAYDEEYTWIIAERLPDTRSRGEQHTPEMIRLSKEYGLRFADTFGFRDQMRYCGEERGNVIYDYGVCNVG